MLLSLTIKNYALIESLEINFSNKFSIITGETGAGKSILLGALGLVLGNRADLTSLKDKEQKCIIEAQFSLSNYDLKPFFAENDLDYEDDTIIRREILPSGKSRAFVNDSPVNLTELQLLGTYLIDIHSQHETRSLTNEEYQIGILDIVAQNNANLITFREHLKALKAAQKELDIAIATRAALAKEQEYNSFLLQELLTANLKEGEQVQLEEELEQLSNVEQIRENLDKVLALAHEENVGVLISMNEIRLAFQKLASFSKENLALSDRFESVWIEFNDIVTESHERSEKVIKDPERLEYVNEKLQVIYNLQKKHQVGTIEELLVIQADLDAKVVKVDDLQHEIEKLNQQVESLRQKVETSAALIAEKRTTAAPVLSKQIMDIIAQLGMPDAQLMFEIQRLDSFNKFGNTSVNLQFSANKGLALGEIKKVASGGEMSRIMLAVKAVLATYSKLPSIIFDEIDTGVSGEIAIKMGEIMKQMSDNMQVFAITHLPQIAAKGDQHYKVFKYNQEGTTISEIKLLPTEDRIVEIAEMLSGKSITDSALIHAKALLN
ncbi:DNA repair protein RecN [Flavobacterium chuncheonense]|uniref:DNA repair protein RecN n=1 Tax=Flavobacterium chuncheonense TaxID=2026653 RepID=A0ABW5YLZ9_9FLAO